METEENPRDETVPTNSKTGPQIFIQTILQRKLNLYSICEATRKLDNWYEILHFKCDNCIMLMFPF